MNEEEIKKLIRLVEESGINELEVAEGRKRIRILKGGPVPVAPATPASRPPEAIVKQENTAGEISAQPEEENEEKLASNLKRITSPMVGTFYRAPAPGAEPFVGEGQMIAVGQTVCIVEAMKLMNEIGSDYNGVVRKVLVENAQPVEYGQPLFLVELQ